MVCEIYSGTRNVTNVTKKVENGLPHVCLNMLCFSLLKSIGIATLFSQLWKLNNFAKKIIKKGWKILDFRENFPEVEKNLKSEKFRNFSLKIILEIEIFEILIFDFQYDFQWKFPNIFFGFEIFSDFRFFRKSRNFQRILMILFAKLFKIQS